MPKLKPNEQEERNRIVRAAISSNMELYSVPEDEVAIKAGFTKRTLQNKRARPETFTLEELQRIGKALKFTPVQAASIVLGRVMTSKEVKEFVLM